jgi:RimJ/RimL family protein N-acetyltransferase
MVPIPIFETERLVVRPFRLDDAGEVGFLFPEQVPDREKAEWLQWISQNHIMLERLGQAPYGDRAVCLKDGGELVGSVGVVPYVAEFERLPIFGGRRPSFARAEVGLFWTIRPEHRNQGYATEAAAGLIGQLFERLHLKQVIAATGKDNLASQAVMRKLGMQVEIYPYEDPPPELPVVGVLWNPEA